MSSTKPSQAETSQTRAQLDKYPSQA